MRRAHAEAVVALPPAEALALWSNPGKWRSFVDQFARVVEPDESWPAPGAELVWESTPDGRGRVRERVEDYEAPPPGPEVAAQSDPGRIVTRVSDESLTGTQTITFAPGEGGTHVELTLDYELERGGALAPVTDFLFIRRALRDSLRRTLERFEEAASAGGS